MIWADGDLVQAMQRKCPDVYVLPDREGDGFSFIRTNGDRLTRQQAVSFLAIMGVTPPDSTTEKGSAAMSRRSGDEDYCGCCGNECDQPGLSSDWCSRCLPHVLKEGWMHERSYFAQYRTDCPYQVGKGSTGAGEQRD